MSKHLATVYQCDNPGCKQVVVAHQYDRETGEVRTRPFGFHGTVLLLSSEGGDSTSWFACGSVCIQGAVTGSLSCGAEWVEP